MIYLLFFRKCTPGGHFVGGMLHCYWSANRTRFFLLFKLLLPHCVNSVSLSCFKFYCDCIRNLPVITFIKKRQKSVVLEMPLHCLWVSYKFPLLAYAGNSWLRWISKVCYLQYWLHYSWTLVSPRCRTLTIVLVSLRRKSHSSFVCRRKNHQWVFGAIVRKCLY